MMFPVKQRMSYQIPEGRTSQRGPYGRPPHPPRNPFLKGAMPAPGYKGPSHFTQGPMPAAFTNTPKEANQFPGQKNISQVMSMFQTPEGQLDIEKLSKTAQQVHQIYNDVSPLVSSFLKNK